MIQKVRYKWNVYSLLILMALTGCAGLLSSGTVKEEPREEVILAMKVKAALIEEPKLSAAAIHVEISNDVVILSGFVETESQRQLASTVSHQVPGVKKIDNKIEVK
ncbi:MAG: BON domain-containing protein [Nitrosomonas sp.]|nr:BON domain-containing protein [Nitrosomonas sp.]